MPTEALAPRSTSHVTIFSVLRALHAKRRTLYVFVFCFFLLGVAASVLIKESFTASTTVLPPPDSAAGLGSLGGMSGATILALGGHSSSELYVQLLRSRSVADTLIQEFHLQQVFKAKFASQTRDILAGKTSIEVSDKSGLITISVTDGNRKEAADLANGYVAAYQKISAHLAISQAARKREFFSQQLLNAKNNLADAEQKLALTQKTTGFVQPESQTQALITSAANLRAQVAAKHVQIEGMRSYATAENPQMQQAESELAGLESQLAALEHSNGTGGDSLIMAKNAVQSGGLEYIRRLRDVKYYETLFDLLARQLEAAHLEEAREGNGIEVVDAAIVPDRKSGPKRSILLAGSVAFGFALGCFWILGRIVLVDLRRRFREAPVLTDAGAAS